MIKATASGGAGDYFYEWSLDGNIVGTESLLEEASAGTYLVTVSDGAGCIVLGQTTVDPPSALVVGGNARDVSCPGDKDGEIRVDATGGISNLPYTFNWSNGDIGPLSANLTVGSYTVTATDVNGCTSEASFDVGEPLPLEVTVESEPASDGCNGMVRVVARGGTEPYTYEWANIEGTDPNNPIVSELCPGVYAVKVTDRNGCTSDPELTLGVVDDRRFPCFEERVVITPDGDGLNDEFLIFCIDELIDNKLEIYNRWGQLVYEVENYDNTWEGTTGNGEDLPAGPYYYILEYKDPNNQPIQRKGSITLVRE